MKNSRGLTISQFFRIIEVEGPSLYFLSKRSRDAEKTRACIADLGHYGQEDF